MVDGDIYARIIY